LLNDPERSGEQLRQLAESGFSLPIVKATIVMAKELGLMTLAEGVVTAKQLRMLRSPGCDQFQGHLLGRPMHAEAFGALLGGAAVA